MAEGQIVNDYPSALHWTLSWLPTTEPADGAEATSGLLEVSVAGQVVWAIEDGDWPWIELLQWLAKSWMWLRGEDGLPVSLRPDPQSLRSWLTLLASAELTDVSLGGSRAAMDLWSFRNTHDLSRALKGAEAPGIIVWREGLLGHLLTPDSHHVASWSEVRASLSGLGDAIAQRLSLVTDRDQRAQDLIREWNQRDIHGALQWLDVARRADSPRAAPLSTEWDQVRLGELERSPIFAAARMTSKLPASVANEILSQLHALPKRNVSIPQLADLAQHMEIDRNDHRPFEEGYAFANAFRYYLDLAPSSAFSPRDWLAKQGVEVREISLEDRSVEAIAAWGEANGPAILLNSRGVSSSASGGRNASLAHEIAHLIIDRSSALPAAEVLVRGAVNPLVEQRARAFAAELLLPRSIAGSRFAAAETRADGEHVLRSLRAKYGVGSEVAAWQARNSDSWLGADVYEYLRTLVSRPYGF